MALTEGEKVTIAADKAAFQNQMGQIGQGDWTNPDNIQGRMAAHTRSMQMPANYNVEAARTRNAKQDKDEKLETRQNIVRFFATIAFFVTCYLVDKRYPNEVWWVTVITGALAAAAAALAAWILTSKVFWGLLIIGGAIFYFCTHMH